VAIAAKKFCLDANFFSQPDLGDFPKFLLKVAESVNAGSFDVKFGHRIICARIDTRA